MIRRSLPLAVLLILAVPIAAFAAARLHPSPRSIDFGSRCVRSASSAQLVTVRNQGNADATDVTVTLEPEEAQPVFRLGGQLERKLVREGKDLNFRVGFTAPREGRVEGEAIIRYSRPRPSSSATPSPSPAVVTTRVPLAGSGIDRFISTSPQAVDFGKLRMGRSSAVRTVRIYDDGATPLDLFSAVVSGRHAADFRIIDAPARRITEGNPTSIRLRFKPGRAGARTADLVLRSNSCDDQTLTVPLGGLAIEPVIRVVPEKVDFGVLKLDRTKRKRITITNDGEQNLRIRDISFAADADGVYRVDGFPNRFPLTLKPHRSKTLSVLFQATKPGPVGARLVVTSNDRDDKVVAVTLEGATILPPPPPSPSSTPGAVQQGGGFSISFDRYAPELAVIGAVTGFFMLLLLLRRWRGIPE